MESKIRAMGLDNWEGRKISHVLDKAFVGKDMALEMEETYYTDALQCFCELDDHSNLRRLLSQDVFGVGLIPSTVLGNLVIVIDLRDHRYVRR